MVAPPRQVAVIRFPPRTHRDSTHMSNSGPGGTERETVHVLLASSRDWFASALQAVLEPEGFSFSHVRAGESALREAPAVDPDVVIIDEGLPDATAPELCRQLLEGSLRKSVPVLVYSPNFWHESEQAEAMRAGAWDIIREPIRSRLLVVKLRRLLQIKRLIERTADEALSDAETGLFNLAGLMRTLPILGSLAERSEAPLSCAVLGPTVVAAGTELERQRRDTARLCASHTRMSDVCAWVGESDVALVAYNASVTTATSIVRRLSGLAESLRREGEEAISLSAGIVELPPGQFVAERRAALAVGAEAGARPVADRIASLARFAAAQNALRQVRDEGGGIRIAETS